MKKILMIALMLVCSQMTLSFDGQEGHESGNGHTRKPVAQKIRTY